MIKAGDKLVIVAEALEDERNGTVYVKLTSDSQSHMTMLTENCKKASKEVCQVEKCTDCNEYNQEKHYCPKFCDVIRDTTKEMQDFYKGEHEKLERIEQIYRQWSEIGDNADSWAFSEIGEVLEQE